VLGGEILARYRIRWHRRPPVPGDAGAPSPAGVVAVGTGAASATGVAS
jgi:hypothetical protein